MKKRYVDAIHESASISEELSSMADLKSVYMEMYFNAFVREFDERAEYYIGVIEESLGVKTFDFDRQLWQKAARSKAVKEYFASANIKGGYSTLTFLSYYLKHLDGEKLNDEQRGLMGLLEYLKKKEDEKFSQCLVLILYDFTLKQSSCITLSTKSARAYCQCSKAELQTKCRMVNLALAQLYELSSQSVSQQCVRSSAGQSI
eukprot:TRINITY_DN4097_c0_g4_i1.p1 TRINITY_DN4097_c0_g4~~TRINITY_DN4097_c0_g4_i1.p1  ORF type:complete len:230 (+),score=4.38 TRINITY_DN4097_c0_g4_i1:84-692(+)